MTKKASLLVGLSVASVSVFSVRSAYLDALISSPLDTLGDIKVVSATRNALSLEDTPAAVYVITAKEIERSGARSVADALVLAPGLHVAKVAAYDWAISARSKNKELSNSLLVMVDGRSVFNGMFSGVDWDLIPVSLKNIERIEVVLGPVGTIWGGNAANAVINIITLDAEDSPRNHFSGAVGNYRYQEFQTHQGGRVSDNVFASGYLEYVKHMPWATKQENTKDQQHYRVETERFGLRADYQKDRNTSSFQLGGIRSNEDYQWFNYTPHYLSPDQDGPDLVAYEAELHAEEYFAGLSYIHEAGSGEQWGLQFWLTYSSSDDPARNADFTRFDAESTYFDPSFADGRLLLGMDFRLTDENFRQVSQRDAMTFPYVRTTDEPRFINRNISLYFNYTYPLSDTTDVMFGNRWQYFNVVDDTFSQPQWRLIQSLGNHRIWVGWGRSVITPAREGRSTDDRRNYYQSNIPFCDPENPANCSPWTFDFLQSYQYLSNAELAVQDVETYEIGYRYGIGERLQLDANVFISQESNVPAWQLASVSRQLVLENPSPGAAGTVIDVYRYKKITPLIANAYGGEVSVKWKPVRALQINANYSYRQISVDCQGVVCRRSEGPMRQYENEPFHFANMQIMWDVSADFWLSNVVHYVAASDPHPIVGEDDNVAWPKVITWDLVAGWKPTSDALQFNVTIENLFNNQVEEFPQNYTAFSHATQFWLEVDWQWP